MFILWSQAGHNQQIRLTINWNTHFDWLGKADPHCSLHLQIRKGLIKMIGGPPESKSQYRPCQLDPGGISGCFGPFKSYVEK